MKIEIGKKYKVRDDSEVKYVEIIDTCNNYTIDGLKGTVILKCGDRHVTSFTSDGSYLNPGTEDSWDLVEEYNPTTGQDAVTILALIGSLIVIALIMAIVNIVASMILGPVGYIVGTAIMYLMYFYTINTDNTGAIKWI